MKQKKGKAAFQFCVRIILLFAGVAFLSLIGTLIVMGVYGVSSATVQAALGILMVFLFNLSLVCPVLITRKLARPLDKLTLASKQLAKGDFTADLTYSGNIQELESVFGSMREMESELSSVETLRSDFVSTVSHEFKTPLASIEGYATLLQNPDITADEQRECTDKILAGTRRLSTLVSNVLMLSRLERGTVTPELITYRLDDQIMQILLEQEPVWNARNIEFDLDCEEITYHGAETLLYHVWSNLIGNAVKYSPDGGEVSVSLKKEDGRILFRISDHGPGIAEKDINHIFEKFYQADTDHKKEGNGLGLAQVRQILNLLGGTVTVQSDGRNGSEFTVTLPES